MKPAPAVAHQEDVERFISLRAGGRGEGHRAPLRHPGARQAAGGHHEPSRHPAGLDAGDWLDVAGLPGVAHARQHRVQVLAPAPRSRRSTSCGAAQDGLAQRAPRAPSSGWGSFRGIPATTCWCAVGGALTAPTTASSTLSGPEVEAARLEGFLLQQGHEQPERARVESGARRAVLPCSPARWV